MTDEIQKAYRGGRRKLPPELKLITFYVSLRPDDMIKVKEYAEQLRKDGKY